MVSNIPGNGSPFSINPYGSEPEPRHEDPMATAKLWAIGISTAVILLIVGYGVYILWYALWQYLIVSAAAMLVAVAGWIRSDLFDDHMVKLRRRLAIEQDAIPPVMMGGEDIRNHFNAFMEAMDAHDVVRARQELSATIRTGWQQMIEQSDLLAAYRKMKADMPDDVWMLDQIPQLLEESQARQPGINSWTVWIGIPIATATAWAALPAGLSSWIAFILWMAAIAIIGFVLKNVVFDILEEPTPVDHSGTPPTGPFSGPYGL